MLTWKPVLAAFAVTSLMTAAVAEQRRGDQYQAYKQVKAGHVMPLRDIESRVVPKMAGATYLGPEFDPATSTYRLKFMRDASVIWIDVDARTGQVVGRSGY